MKNLKIREQIMEKESESQTNETNNTNKDKTEKSENKKWNTKINKNSN